MLTAVVIMCKWEVCTWLSENCKFILAFCTLLHAGRHTASAWHRDRRICAIKYI